MRRQARREAVAAAAEFSRRLGVEVAEPHPDPELLVMTGHQPEIYHPGIWSKVFVLQRLADETGAAAIDLVVDSDAFEALGIAAPSMEPAPGRRQEVLAVAPSRGCYGGAPVPSAQDLARFRARGLEALQTLPAPAIARHFAQFCDALESARREAQNLAELVTFGRRRYEAPARTSYLELSVTHEARTAAFSAFAADIAIQVERFHEAYNGALRAFRRGNRTRSPAQPLPDLGREGGCYELPFWHLAGAERREVWAEAGDPLLLRADGEVLARLPREPAAASRALSESPVRLAPKALALTLYQRAFVADLFIHGVGGARYDVVTDALARDFYAVDLPPFAVASLTLYLPLGAPVVTEQQIDEAERRLERLTHNPDEALEEAELENEVQRTRGEALVREKRRLVEEVERPGADKRTLGARIREVNREMKDLLAPHARELMGELEALRRQRNAYDVLTDRTYPFCFWNPIEVLDKTR